MLGRHNDGKVLMCRFRVPYGPQLRRKIEPNHYSASIKDGPQLTFDLCGHTVFQPHQTSRSFILQHFQGAHKTSGIG